MDSKVKYHYVYRISNIVTDMHYYGKRSSYIEPSLDLGVNYISSSTDDEFIQDQIDNPEDYEYTVVAIADTAEEALGIEVYLHDYYNVGVNPKFYNRAKQTSDRFIYLGGSRTTRELGCGKDIAMHSTGTFTCRIPTDEALLAMKDLSSGAFKLLIYYYSKSTGWKFIDEQIAETIGISLAVMKRLKKELIDKGYLYIEKGTNFNTYFIGRKAVLEWNNPDLIDE